MTQPLVSQQRFLKDGMERDKDCVDNNTGPRSPAISNDTYIDSRLGLGPLCLFIP